MSRPKVLICVLCGTERTDWINPALLVDLLFMLHADERFEVRIHPVMDYRPFEFARNKTIALAREHGADWLISFDNDAFVDGNALDVIEEAGEDKHIIGLTSGIGHAPHCLYFPNVEHGAEDGTFREEFSIGGSVLMVNKKVWQTIPKGPWFHWVHADNELHAPDVGGMTEDVYFCNLAKEHGFKIWTHRTIMAGHMKTSNVTGIVACLDEITGGRWTREYEQNHR